MKKNRIQRRIENNKLKLDNERLQKTCNALSEDRQFWIEKGTTEKERADRFERKYYERLKDEVVYNHKQVVTLSLMVTKDRCYDALNFPRQEYDEYCKRKITQLLAEALCNNYDCLKIEETEIGTRIDAMLLNWNTKNELLKEYEQLKCKFEPFSS